MRTPPQLPPHPPWMPLVIALCMLAIIVAFGTGCASLDAFERRTGFNTFEIREPIVAPLRPIYRLPTITLRQKADVLTGRLIARHLDADGLLLYNVDLSASSDAADHDQADAPTWTGYLLAGLAAKQRVEPDEGTGVLLQRVLRGLVTNFEATGQPGVLARSYYRHSGDRLPWMREDKWSRGAPGFWIRPDIAKGHIIGAVMGLAAVACRDTPGPATLQADATAALHAIVTHGLEHDWRFGLGEWGDLGDHRYNGFDGLIVMAMLTAAGRTNHPRAAGELDRLVHQGAGTVVALELGAMMQAYASGGRQLFSHFSDDLHIVEALYTIELCGPVWPELEADLGFVARKLWLHLRYRQNSFATYALEHWITPNQRELDEARQTLLWFPDDKRQVPMRDVRPSQFLQPIPNQRINSHYWKTNPFKAAEPVPGASRTDVEYSGQDYLSAYWIGRHRGRISPQD